MTDVIIRVLDSDGIAVTGLNSTNIKFRKSPYSSGDEIGGLTVTEIGTQGNYKITGFIVWQKARLYINGIFQEWWSEQFTGNPANNFIDFTSAQTISGAKTLSGNNTHPGNNTFSGSNTHNGSELFSGSVEFDNTAVFVNGQQALMLGDTIIRNPLIADPALTPGTNNLLWKSYTDSNYAPVNENRIIVDAKAPAEITGKVYRSIGSAVNYAYNNGSPSITNRWEILVIPHPEGFYTEAFYWYDFIDVTGIGWVKIKNSPTKSVFIRSGAMTDRNVKSANLHFESTDTNLNLKKMITDNCSVVMIEGDIAPTLTLEDSQFRNCNFGLIGTATFTATGENRAINCTGGKDISWGGSDKIYNWLVIEGDYIQQ